MAECASLSPYPVSEDLRATAADPPGKCILVSKYLSRRLSHREVAKHHRNSSAGNHESTTATSEQLKLLRNDPSLLVVHMACMATLSGPCQAGVCAAIQRIQETCTVISPITTASWHIGQPPPSNILMSPILAPRNRLSFLSINAHSWQLVSQ